MNKTQVKPNTFQLNNILRQLPKDFKLLKSHPWHSKALIQIWSLLCQTHLHFIYRVSMLPLRVFLRAVKQMFYF